MLPWTVATQVRGCEIPGCEEGTPFHLVCMDDVMQEPDARALVLCEPHLQKWETARQEKAVATPIGPVLFCQLCRRTVGLLDAEALADWITHQYGMGPVVGWLCPDCRTNSDEAS